MFGDVINRMNDTRWSYDLCTLTQSNLSCLAQYLGVPK
jgi:hypothetical protein